VDAAATHKVALALDALTATFAFARFFQGVLFRQQRALAVYVAANAFATFLITFVPLSSQLYYRIFLGFESTMWVLQVLAVREIFALATARYPGIRTVGRRIVVGAVLVSAVTSVLVTTALWQNRASSRPTFLYFFVTVDRTILFSLAVIVISILLFLSHYPLNLHRNTYVSTALFSIGFLTQAAAQVIDILSPKLYSKPTDIAQSFISAASFFIWGLMLQRQNEAPEPQISFPTHKEQELLDQLESLNRLLSRAGRR
jgi:hypothetical protein